MAYWESIMLDLGSLGLHMCSLQLLYRGNIGLWPIALDLLVFLSLKIFSLLEIAEEIMLIPF